MPSSATSQPAASTRARSGEPSTRIGLVLLMWMKMRRAGNAGERGERAVVAVDRHVAHAAAGLGAGAGRDHLVVAKQRAVEEHHVGARHALAHRRRHRGGARDDRRCARSPAADLDADIGRGLARGVRILAFEIERHLAGHREQLAPAGRPEARTARRARARCRVTRSGASTSNIVLSAMSGKRRGRGAERERLALAQAQQAGHLIDLGAGQHHRLDRAAARCRARMQRGRSPNCWRRSGEALTSTQFSPSADTARLACVRGTHARVASPGQAAHRATAIPLRKAPARRRAEHDGGQAPHSGLSASASDQNSAGR